jgi:hypothetical protein
MFNHEKQEFNDYFQNPKMAQRAQSMEYWIKHLNLGK